MPDPDLQLHTFLQQQVFFAQSLRQKADEKKKEKKYQGHEQKQYVLSRVNSWAAHNLQLRSSLADKV